MPETRYVRVFDDGVEIDGDPYEVSDKELEEEAEQNAMQKAREMIDAISNLAQAKVFLKKLCRRLFANGALP